MLKNVEFILAQLGDVESVAYIYQAIHEDLEKTINYPKWPKDIYPTETSALNAIQNQELYILKVDCQIVGSVILNHDQNTGYEQADWLVNAPEEKVLVIHTLAIHPHLKGQGYAGVMLDHIKKFALQTNHLALRLDLTQGNLPARYLYQKHGFYFTGIADLHRQEDGINYCEMFEYNLKNPQDQLEFIEKLVYDFVEERGWHPYHTADNLAKSIIIEAAELLECFQWDDADDIVHVCEELSDVLIYSIQLAQYLQVDIKDILIDKMQKNRHKYPVENV